MKFADIEIKCKGSQLGLKLYESGKYLLTYPTLNECILDLFYHFHLDDFSSLKMAFAHKIKPPFKYRGVCSEIFWPTDDLNRYVTYGNTLSEILDAFGYHEYLAQTFPDKFEFGGQGCSIFLFDPNDAEYKFWLGGDKFSSVSAIIDQAKNENKLIPDAALEEISSLGNIVKPADVFISHKSDDLKCANQVYDVLKKNGYAPFLSELSLPNIANADYAYEIDKALESAKHLVVVATSREKIMSGWVMYEWQAFANEKRSGRKDGNLITVLAGMTMDELPFLLRQYEVIPIENLENIINFLPKQ